MQDFDPFGITLEMLLPYFQPKTSFDTHCKAPKSARTVPHKDIIRESGSIIPSGDGGDEEMLRFN